MHCALILLTNQASLSMALLVST